ncbi:MAG TPA: hypothetical protein VHV27_13375 [Phenylobacterium sp.]|jgi:hypothetical protein|nr:hypothetical protein [Phenylobacterium sp.]
MSAFDVSPPRDSTFRLGQRGDVWFVTRDNVFYGDYSSRARAVDAAAFAARAVEARGGSAKVLDIPGDVVIPHGAAAPPTPAAPKPRRRKA